MVEEPDPYALPPEVEAQRLRSLDQLHVLHSPPEDRFAHITRMARVALGVPMSAINFIDRHTQWCKQYSADHQLDFDVPRRQSVCRATIARAYQRPGDRALVYADLADSEFSVLPAVAQEGGVRFYAGFPLFGPGWHPVGTFCVYDTKPRQMSAQERATFKELAAWAQRELQNPDHQRSLDVAAVGICLTDPEGRFIEVNDALCKHFGYDADTLLQKTWEDITAPDFLQADLGWVAEMVAGDRDFYRTVNQFVHADGHLIWGDLSVACIRGDGGQVLRFIAQIVDITNEVRSREDLVESRDLLRATVDSMLTPQALLKTVRDSAGQVVDFTYRSANRAFCSYRGWEEHSIVGTSLLQAQPNLVETGLFDRYVDCVETGVPVVLDDFGLVNAMLGEHRYFDIRVVRAGADLLSLTFGDVTDRYHAAQRIAESEERYRMLALNFSDAVLHIRDGVVVWASPAIEEVLGAPPERWVGTHVRDATPPGGSRGVRGAMGDPERGRRSPTTHSAQLRRWRHALDSRAREALL